ncbi:LOW QUALITY PROTEIN: acidic mammalian chitinase-like [Macrobrachium rosenbergii]|uniref:LOW QUALITY PROTEIN: acidic mammalian chitinase-like n=1 Tax=Macrobrachium rosenbergii TaxID=79674 RepID=UPI0034D6775F
MRLLLLLSLISLSLYLTEGVTLVCYFSSWAVYRQEAGKFDIEDNDPTLCSHLIYAFAGLGTNNEIKVLDPYNDLCENWGKCGYDRFTKLKEKNIYLKTILGVGGWNEGSTKYSEMAADPAKRKIFIDSTITLLKKHDFDGLDMDWEYPTQRGGNPEDYVNYISLLKELSEALHAEGMILTAAVSAGKATIDPAYNIPEMSKYLDVINLMTYDLHGSWEPYAHHHSILYAHPNDTGETLWLNQDFAVNYWLEKGAPKEKMVLGVPFYGRTFRLKDETNTGIYAPAPNPGMAGPYTRQTGFLGYNEICEAQLTTSWTIVHDPDMNEPYAYYFPYNYIWVGYEDPDSVAIKAQYALDKGLAGCMVWSVETDDFHGTCHGRKFPLLNTLLEVLSGGIVTKPPTAPPKTTTTRDPSAPTTTTPRVTGAPGVHCSKMGPNADEGDCTHYYICDKDSSGWIEFEYHCSDGTLFNPVGLICDWTDRKCSQGYCPNDCP